MKIILAMATFMMFATTALAQTGSVTLTWTAVGDDSLTGTATSFDIRYSTSAITSGNFASATRWTGPVTALPPGTQQSVTITGLSIGATYYFAIKTIDDAGNTAGISNIATKTLADGIRPAPITVNLTAITDSSVTMNWTAVGNDSLSGTASSYDIRYSTATITSANWASATQVTGEPIPAAPGTSQSYVVRGLSRQVTYYFAIRALDGSGNMSVLSNVPSATTPDGMKPAAITNLSAN